MTGGHVSDPDVGPAFSDTGSDTVNTETKQKILPVSPSLWPRCLLSISPREEPKNSDLLKPATAATGGRVKKAGVCVKLLLAGIYFLVHANFVASKLWIWKQFSFEKSLLLRKWRV